MVQVPSAVYVWIWEVSSLSTMNCSRLLEGSSGLGNASP